MPARSVRSWIVFACLAIAGTVLLAHGNADDKPQGPLDQKAPADELFPAGAELVPAGAAPLVRQGGQGGSLDDAELRLRKLNPNVLHLGEVGGLGHMGIPMGIPTGDVILVKGPEPNEYLAWSPADGRWRSHTFPKGVTAIIVIGWSGCVFHLEGDAITELVAIDRRGRWCFCKLPAAAKQCIPIVGRGTVAACQVEGAKHVYAFSAETGTWAAFETAGIAPAAAGPMVGPMVGKDTVVMVEPGAVAAFSAATGEWAVAKTAK